MMEQFLEIGVVLSGIFVLAGAVETIIDLRKRRQSRDPHTAIISIAMPDGDRFRIKMPRAEALALSQSHEKVETPV